MDEPLKKDSIRYIDQMPQLQDLSPDDVIIVQDVSETTPGSNPYRKETLQHVVDRMNPLQSVNLTQAEYDALPEAEKLNGTYYNITDDSPPPFQIYFDVEKPVGYVYTQLPPTIDEDGVTRTPLDPNALFNNEYIHSVWKRLNYDGAFFRAEGTGASVFGSGLQIDTMQGHTHDITTTGGSATNGSSFVQGRDTQQNILVLNGKISEPKNDGTNGEPRISEETRPKNFTDIKWIRIA